MASYTSDNDTDNFHCLVSLLIDVGSKVLRKLFAKYVFKQQHSLDAYLSKYQCQLQVLANKKVITQSQMVVLFPRNGNANEETFDITLLSCLFKNTCERVPLTEKQNIEKLREYRNTIVGHAVQAKVDLGFFNTKFKEISQVLDDLAKCCGDANFPNDVKNDITQVLNKPNRYLLDVLRQWHESDKEIICQVEDVKSELAIVKKQNDGLNTELENVKETVTYQNEDVKVKVARVENSLEKIAKKSKVFMSDIESTGLQTIVEDNKEQISTVQLDIRQINNNLCLQEQKIYNLEERTERIDLLQNLKDHSNALVQQIRKNGQQPVETRQIQSARELLHRNGRLKIIGDDLHGKSYIAYVLMSEQPDCVALDDPSDLKYISTEGVKLVLLDISLDRDEERWLNVLKKLNSLGLKIILILKKGSPLECLDLFESTLDLTDEANELDLLEKTRILQYICAKHGRQISEESARKCAAAYGVNIGETFIACCDLFAKEPDKFKENEIFFKQPFELLLKSFGKMKENEKMQFEMLLESCGLYKTNTRESHLCKWIRCQTLDDDEEYTFQYSFIHSVIHDAGLLWYSQRDPRKMVEVAPVSFLCKFVRLGKQPEYTSVITLPRSAWKKFAERLIRTVIDDKDLYRVSDHPAFTNTTFVDDFFSHLQFICEFENFFTSHVYQSTGITFVRILVQLMKQDHKYLLSKCFETLSCEEDLLEKPVNERCWKCRQKVMALETSIAENNDNVSDILARDLRVVSPRSILQCIRFKKYEYLKPLLTHLKTVAWNKNDVFIQEALMLINDQSEVSDTATRSNLRNLFKDNGIEMNVHCLATARVRATSQDLREVIDMLKKANKWDINDNAIRDELRLLYMSDNAELKKIAQAEYDKTTVPTLGILQVDIDLD